jgi:hypothetical protein
MNPCGRGLKDASNGAEHSTTAPVTLVDDSARSLQLREYRSGSSF